MKVRVTIPDIAGRSIDETISGADADDILSAGKGACHARARLQGLVSACHHSLGICAGGRQPLQQRLRNIVCYSVKVRTNFSVSGRTWVTSPCCRTTSEG